MRRFGMGKYADELIVTLNRAAEAAVPEAQQLFVDAVRQMSVQDAKGVLTGGDTAGTQYFRRTTEETLRSRFLPVVQRTTARVGLAQKYNQYAARGVRVGLVDAADANLDDYVTRKALDGLYFMVAEEERKIRKEQFTLDDFLQQMQQVRNMGPLGSLLKMMPGIGSQLGSLNVDEKELDRLSKMPPQAAEYTVARTYLDWLVSLPWSAETEDKLDVGAAKTILDEDHFDLEKIKATPPISESKRTELIKALEKVDVETFYGRVKFATEGDYYHANVGLNPLTIQIQNGKVVVVGPRQSAEVKAQYPMTRWDKR